MLPVLGRKVIEGKKHLAILGQAGCSLVVFGHILGKEAIEIVGEGFDPEAFSAEAADALVAARFGRP